jgi:hypothetical protein
MKSYWRALAPVTLAALMLTFTSCHTAQHKPFAKKYGSGTPVFAQIGKKAPPHVAAQSHRKRGKAVKKQESSSANYVTLEKPKAKTSAPAPEAKVAVAKPSAPKPEEKVTVSKPETKPAAKPATTPAKPETKVAEKPAPAKPDPKTAAKPATPAKPEPKVAEKPAATPAKPEPKMAEKPATAPAPKPEAPKPAAPAAPGVGARAEAPKSFSWNYTFQPEPGKRTWKLENGNKTYVETYPSGKQNKFNVVQQSTKVDNITGTVVQQEGKPLQAFIPDKGSQPMHLKMRGSETQQWDYMGEINNVDSPNP